MNVIKPERGPPSWTMRKVCPGCDSVLVFHSSEVRRSDRLPPYIVCGGCGQEIILWPWERKGPFVFAFLAIFALTLLLFLGPFVAIWIIDLIGWVYGR